MTVMIGIRLRKLIPVNLYKAVTMFFRKEQLTKTETITAVKIYRSRTEISNRFHVDFITNENKVLANYYSWQHHLSNVWHNNKIDGEITIPIF